MCLFKWSPKNINLLVYLYYFAFTLEMQKGKTHLIKNLISNAGILMFVDRIKFVIHVIKCNFFVDSIESKTYVVN